MVQSGGDRGSSWEDPLENIIPPSVEATTRVGLMLMQERAYARFECEAMVALLDPTSGGTRPGYMPAFTPSAEAQAELRSVLGRLVAQKPLDNSDILMRAEWVVRDPFIEQVPQDGPALTEGDLGGSEEVAPDASVAVYAQRGFVTLATAAGMVCYRDKNSEVRAWCEKEALARGGAEAIAFVRKARGDTNSFTRAMRAIRARRR